MYKYIILFLKWFWYTMKSPPAMVDSHFQCKSCMHIFWLWLEKIESRLPSIYISFYTSKYRFQKKNTRFSRNVDSINMYVIVCCLRQKVKLMYMYLLSYLRCIHNKETIRSLGDKNDWRSQYCTFTPADYSDITCWLDLLLKADQTNNKGKAKMAYLQTWPFE